MKFFLGRFASIKADSMFLFNDIFRSSPFINEFFFIDQELCATPSGFCFRVQLGKEILLIEEFDPVQSS